MKAAKGVDFVLNALATAWDLPVMEACLEAGRHYLDMGAGGPRDITGAADLDEQLALDDDFDTGELLRRFRYQTTSHDESWERWGVQGAAFQTGASAACAVTQFARGEIVRRGGLARRGARPRGLHGRDGEGRPGGRRDGPAG